MRATCVRYSRSNADGSPPAASATSSSTLVLTGVSALSVITAVFVTIWPLTTDWTDRGYRKVDTTGRDGQARMGGRGGCANGPIFSLFAAVTVVPASCLKDQRGRIQPIRREPDDRR